MLNPRDFAQELKRHGVEFFVGVPDSLLGSFLNYIENNSDKGNFNVSANEGSAVAYAAGYQIATQKIPVVYLQNSGIGNALNPLLSLADPMVYSIPMLLLVGWRGEPGTVDEPQHLKQGECTVDLFRSVNIPFYILESESNFKKILDNAISDIKSRKGPVALLVKAKSFSKYEVIKNHSGFLTRSSSINKIYSMIKEKDQNSVIFSTTGKISREIYKCAMRKFGECNEFLNVGSMGHVNQIALAFALKNKNKNIYCFDGDGACLMHLGSLATIAEMKPKNFRHLIFNNSAHDSVGGQATCAPNIDFKKISSAIGYEFSDNIKFEKDLDDKINSFINSKQLSLIEIIIAIEKNEELPRPKKTPKENLEKFMKYISL